MEYGTFHPTIGCMRAGGGNVEKTESIVTLDFEWVLLIIKARGLGLKAEEVRFFLEEEKKKT